MTKGWSPERYANTISKVLNTVLGAERFPIKVDKVAREYSLQCFPNDPITLVAGASLPGFEGALLRAPAGNKGWGIIYNDGMSSAGRINFTLAHEFGHYLLHRLTYPDGMRCSDQDVVRWDSEYRQVEHQANRFAANLLMPLDDYRRQIAANKLIDIDMLTHCAARYEVSLIAATLRWLEYTERRAVLAVSRDGFVLWARSSKKALKTGAFIRTSRGPVEVPRESIAARRHAVESPRAGAELPAGVWFNEPCQEMTVFSDQYDFTISLLQLANDDGRTRQDEDEDEGEDLVDRIRRKHGL